MNDDKPTPPASDDHPTTPLPAPAPTETEAAGAAPSENRRRVPRTALLAAAAVGGLLLAGGLGAAIAVGVVGDDDSEQRGTFVSGGPMPGAGGSQPTVSGDEASDVDGMMTAIESARGVVDGVPVGIEERSPGIWRVELQDASGRETKVLVDGSGARVTEQDDDGDDDGADGAELTREVVQALVDAVAADATGRVVQIETDGDDDGGRFEVDVRTPDGSVVELELDGSYVITDRDEDDRPGPGNGQGHGHDKDKGPGRGNGHDDRGGDDD